MTCKSLFLGIVGRILQNVEGLYEGNNFFGKFSKLTYVNICLRMLTSVNICLRLLTSVNIFWHMLTNVNKFQSKAFHCIFVFVF
jgi:hypothetical protein